MPSTRTLARYLAQAMAAVRLRGQVSVLLTTDRNIRRLNRRFRGKDKPTDVLSFPAHQSVQGEQAGDLAVSVPTALRQARSHGHALAVELKVLILHGLLHLAGYNHETDNGEMARRERLLRGRMGLPLGLIERAAAPPLRSPRLTSRSGIPAPLRSPQPPKQGARRTSAPQRARAASRPYARGPRP